MDFKRVAGICGIGFGVIVFTANAFFVGPAKPLGGVPLSEIVSHYSEHGNLIWSFAYVGPIAWVAISLFAAGVVVSTRSKGRLNGWALAGLLGIATMIPTFCGVVTADLVLAARASTLAANPQYTQLLWDCQMVLQILNLTFVALALGGFGMAAVTSATAPRLGKLAAVGALLLLAGATQSKTGLTGAGPALVAIPGFVIWLIFVVGYSVAMIRSPATAST